jgi:hypothetical protein
MFLAGGQNTLLFIFMSQNIFIIIEEKEKKKTNTSKRRRKNYAHNIDSTSSQPVTADKPSNFDVT